VSILQRNTKSPIPVAMQSKSWVCSCSIAGIAGSNLVEGMVCLPLIFVV